MATKKLIPAVTLHGLPVRISNGMAVSSFRRRQRLVRAAWHGQPERWRPLHADIAFNLAQTVREALPALDGDLAFWVAVNTARKALDIKQLELLKSGKRQPVPVSSRCYSIRNKHFTFATVKPEEIGCVRSAQSFLEQRQLNVSRC